MKQKNLKIMAATNWTIIKRNKATNQIAIFNLESKWTYKTAIGIATELNNDETNELVCIVETNKIMLKDYKNQRKFGESENTHIFANVRMGKNL